MKNLHLLPTESYSPLVHSTNKYGGLFLSRHYSPMKEMGDSYQNIYITSDKQIKEGDWILELNDNSVWTIQIQPNTDLSKYKKIILTTDPDLIKDGVQAIDDELLEWFVKNPSCIFIPQEEPEQELEKELFELEQELDIPLSMRWHNSKPKQERMYSEAIEFAEWIRIKDFQTTSKNNWIGLDMKYYTTQELFEQFKKKKSGD